MSPFGFPQKTWRIRDKPMKVFAETEMRPERISFCGVSSLAGPCDHEYHFRPLDGFQSLDLPSP